MQSEKASMCFKTRQASTRDYVVYIFSNITLYILFQIRSRRQKKMIEGGYHGLEGGFEARRRGKRGKGRFWVLNA